MLLNFGKALTLVFAGFLISVSTQARTICFPGFGVTVAVTDSARGAALSMLSDEYTRALTPFDLSIRLHKASGLTEEDYLRAAAADVRNWKSDEIKQLQQAVTGIDNYLKGSGVKLHLPDTIIFISTTAESEFEAEGWTRANRIMLNTGAQPISLHLVAHELFHVLSRHDAATRDAVYAVFGFKPCNKIDYSSSVRPAITNPDCPFLTHYITVDVNGAPVDATLLLYSGSPYNETYTLGDYAKVGLLVLEGKDRDKTPMIRDGVPVILDLGTVRDLFRQIGMNTQYVLHIEEICAEHFAALVGEKKMNQQEFVQNMEKALRQR